MNVPFDNISEQFILGRMLYEPSKIEDVISIIIPKDFYKESHQILCRELFDIYQNQEESVIELSLIVDSLSRSGYLDKIGGIGYLDKLLKAGITSDNIRMFANKVKEFSIRRSLFSLAQKITETSSDLQTPIKSILERIDVKIAALTEKEVDSSMYSLKKDLMGTFVGKIIKRYEDRNFDYEGVASPWKPLNEMLLGGFKDSELTIIGARTSIGKTAFSLNLANYMAFYNKHDTVGFFSLEMSAFSLVERIIALESAVDSRKIKNGFLSKTELNNIVSTTKRISSDTTGDIIIEDTPNIKLMDLKLQARKMKKNYGIKILFIDYMTLISVDNATSPRHEQVAEISRSLKALARELEIPIIALSQVNRDAEGKQPNLANIRESGSIEQDADAIIFLHRERVKEEDDKKLTIIPTKIIVAKHRNGPTGEITLGFTPSTMRFDLISRNNESDDYKYQSNN